MYSLKILRTNSEKKDFQKLNPILDAELKIRDGDDHDFYHQFNHIDSIKNVVVFYLNETAIACGAIKEFNPNTMEIKRMFTIESERNKGIASKILKELESWSQELGFTRCILETGFNQPEAIYLYKKNNYKIIENYGQYKGVSTSICFEKILI